MAKGGQLDFGGLVVAKKKRKVGAEGGRDKQS
jgi:hypothetical protein